MGLNVELLEQSFELVAPQSNKLVETFYQHLFEDYPEVKPLFADADMKIQQTKLLASLKLVVENLRRPEDLQPVLERLGLRHLDYGTTADHYPAVGATLLKSLAEIAGDAWNEELHDAWAEAYGAISEIMLAGTATAAV